MENPSAGEGTRSQKPARKAVDNPSVGEENRKPRPSLNCLPGDVVAELRTSQADRSPYPTITMNNSSVEEYNRKRARKLGPSINDLPDDVVAEILARLTWLESRTRCFAVCKLWRSLLSSPSSYSDPLNSSKSFALIAHVGPPRRSQAEPKGEPHYVCEEENPIFNRLKGFKLQFLPCFSPETIRTVCVWASHNDLLLCSADLATQDIIYICNPLTRQWVELPPLESRHGYRPNPIGFVCDTSSKRFKVLRVLGLEIKENEFLAEVFSSETNRWSEVEVSHPRGLRWFPTHYQPVVFKGILHWLSNNAGPIVAYDPFNPKEQLQLRCRFIERSPETTQRNNGEVKVAECLSVSQGYMSLLQLVTHPKCPNGDEAHNLCVWKLTDYVEGRWTLEHRVYFKEMIAPCPSTQSYVHEFVRNHINYKQRQFSKFSPSLLNRRGYALSEKTHEPDVLACHPWDPHVVYLHLPGSIFSLELRTKKLKFVSRLSRKCRRFNSYDTVCPIVLPLWPTVIPPVISDVHP